MSNKNADKMRTAVVPPTEQIGKLDKEFLESLRNGLSDSIQKECEMVYAAAHAALEKAARVPEPLKLNKQTLEAAVGKLTKQVDALNTLNYEDRVNKAGKILKDAGVIQQPPSNKGPGR